MNAVDTRREGTAARRRALARLAREHRERYRELLAEENGKWQRGEAGAALDRLRERLGGAA